MNNPTLTAALDYASRGWHVFPLRYRSKEPACLHGFKDATVDEGQIRRWWTTHPTWGIGIATGALSGLMVVDIDSQEGTKALIEHVAELPETDRKSTRLNF